MPSPQCPPTMPLSSRHEAVETLYRVAVEALSLACHVVACRVVACHVLHVLSWRVMSCMSCHGVSRRGMSIVVPCHVVAFHVVACQLSSRVMAWHGVTWWGVSVMSRRLSCGRGCARQTCGACTCFSSRRETVDGCRKEGNSLPLIIQHTAPPPPLSPQPTHLHIFMC